MTDVLTAFFFLALVIFSGFFAQAFFRRTGISDFLLLMAIGLLLGPVLHFFDNATVIFLRGIAPFFASLALIFMLFEGGMGLNFRQVLREIGRATLFTFLVFIFTLFSVAGILSAFGWPLLVSLLVGAVLGGTSAEIIIPMLKGLRASKETKTMIFLESTINDAFCLVSAIAILEIMVSRSLDVQGIFQGILAAFAVAAFLGAYAGIFWLKILRDHRETVKPYQYLLTISVLFVLYFLAEYAKGNGAIAVLVFGLVLGNSREITAALGMKETVIDANIRLFQSEIAFFVKTFFFVYLGIIIDPGEFTPLLIALGISIVAFLVLARVAATEVVSRFNRELQADKTVIVSLMARGLATAVLATYVVSAGVDLGEFGGTIIRLTFIAIILTNIATMAGVFYLNLRQKSGIAPQGDIKNGLVSEVLVGPGQTAKEMQLEPL